MGPLINGKRPHGQTDLTDFWMGVLRACGKYARNGGRTGSDGPLITGDSVGPQITQIALIVDARVL
jgi:hypothetical protein